MRIRTVKPEFWPHPVMARQEDAVRLAAIGLLNIADDEGYFIAEPAIVRAAIWPFDEDSSRTRRALAQLTVLGWIEQREHPTQGKVGRVVNFTKHQRIDRPTASKLKTYFLDESSTMIRRGLDESSLLDQGSGIRDQGSREQGIHAPASPTLEGGSDMASDEVENTGNGSKPGRKRDEAFEALGDIEGGFKLLTPSARGSVNRALKDIRSVTPDVTSNEILRRAAIYESHFPNSTLSASALAKHWARCARMPERKAQNGQHPNDRNLSGGDLWDATAPGGEDDVPV